MANIIRLPQLACDKMEELALPLPEDWATEIVQMSGNNQPPLTQEKLRAALSNPLSSLPLRELARGKKEVVIIFDDHTRATRISEIAPLVLDELAAAGIPDNYIRFVCALGLHSPMYRPHFVKKLGQDIVSRFPVCNHNAFGNCAYAGTTETFGTKVYINEGVMKCDLKIAIGLVVPHHLAGFSGGGKIIVPGIASYETTQHNHLSGHKIREKHNNPQVGMGLYDNNPLCQDIDEAARMIGVDFLINCLINGQGKTTAIYAGDLTSAHHEAVREAKSHYLTPKLIQRDIIIANISSPNNVTAVGLIISFPSLSNDGDLVLIANYPEGRVPHYLSGRWGKDTWAVQHHRVTIPEQVNRIIVYNEYPHPGSNWFDDDDRIIYCHKWQEVISRLQDSHNHNVKVTIFPNADIQYCL